MVEVSTHEELTDDEKRELDEAALSQIRAIKEIDTTILQLATAISTHVKRAVVDYSTPMNMEERATLRDLNTTAAMLVTMRHAVALPVGGQQFEAIPIPRSILNALREMQQSVSESIEEETKH